MPLENGRWRGDTRIFDYESTKMGNSLWQLFWGTSIIGKAKVSLIVRELEDTTFERIELVYNSWLDWDSVSDQIVILK